MKIPFLSRPRNRSRAQAEFFQLRRRVAGSIAALVLVTILGIAGYVVVGGEDYGLLDAVYMTFITLTTVGFAEVIDMSNNPAGRMFTVALLVGGMGIVLYTVPMVAQFAMEGQLNHIFSRRRMQKAIAELRGHYIVIGNNEAALHVLDELVVTGRETVVVVPTEELRDEAFYRAADALTVVADPTDDQTLVDAGISHAAGLVICMESDKDNVLCVLGARELAPQARIIAAAERDETRRKLVSAGADAVVSPARIGGLRMASELVRPKVVSFLDTMLRDERALRVEEVHLPAGGETCTLSSLELDRVGGALVLALRNPGAGDFTFKPAPTTAVKPGATIVVMADPDGRRHLEEHVRKKLSGHARQLSTEAGPA